MTILVSFLNVAPLVIALALFLIGRRLMGFHRMALRRERILVEGLQELGAALEQANYELAIGAWGELMQRIQVEAGRQETYEEHRRLRLPPWPDEDWK